MSFSEKLKIKIKEKSNFRCCVCKREFVEVHHIISKSEGGSDELENAAPLCAMCHDLYGGNPEKRKQIKQMRNHWYREVENLKEEVKLTKNFERFVVEEYSNSKEKMLSKKGFIAIYHNVFEHENFETSAQILFDLVKSCIKKSPDLKRVLYLDIEGHRNKEGGYDWDMWELQRYFIFDFLSPYLSEIYVPLISIKTKSQINNIPDKLEIKSKKSPNSPSAEFSEKGVVNAKKG